MTTRQKQLSGLAGGLEEQYRLLVLEMKSLGKMLADKKKRLAELEKPPEPVSANKALAALQKETALTRKKLKLAIEELTAMKKSLKANIRRLNSLILKVRQLEKASGIETGSLIIRRAGNQAKKEPVDPARIREQLAEMLTEISTMRNRRNRLLSSLG